MVNDRQSEGLLNQAMNYGAMLGILWAFRYLLYVWQDIWSPMIYMYYLLNGITFLLIYIFYLNFNSSDEGKPRKRLECFCFVVLLSFFASLIEATMEFFFLYVWNPSYFHTVKEPIMKAIAGVLSNIYQTLAGDISDSTRISILDWVVSRPFYVFLGFLKNIIVGVGVGALFALIIGNKK